MLDNADSTAAKTLEQITVTATRRKSTIESVPATITVIDRNEISNRQPADETDVFKNEPDIALARDLRRFGSTRINIRGIEDNRVMSLVDGVRLADYYDSGGPSNFTMNAPLGIAQDFIKRVEILRGPASSLYGSDAIGGVVGYLSLDSSDVIAKNQNYSVQ